VTQGTTPSFSDLIAVRFRPGGAHAFLPLTVAALTNDVVEARDLLGDAVDDIFERLLGAPTRAQQMRVLVAWLNERFKPRQPQWNLVQSAVHRLRQPARQPVRDVCNALGLSNKHLISLFPRSGRSAAGKTGAHRPLPPRSGRAPCPRRPLLSVAHELAYADQSHFNRDFARFSGVTPTQFLARRAEDGESLIAA